MIHFLITSPNRTNQRAETRLPAGNEPPISTCQQGRKAVPYCRTAIKMYLVTCKLTGYSFAGL